ncbi:hypothetical protein PVK06_027872 [Gossypium arboreum]|uniref:Uncharacterized protein n=1 Tax=Gossypium arboreum TaxID=29729 RepID=A0ABR0P3V7_GOSAR|nr:hypothetical protein PVK06_027872 [Gossypium arboreum]
MSRHRLCFGASILSHCSDISTLLVVTSVLSCLCCTGGLNAGKTVTVSDWGAGAVGSRVGVSVWDAGLAMDSRRNH